MCQKRTMMILVVLVALLLMQTNTFWANNATPHAVCNPTNKGCSGGHKDSNATSDTTSNAASPAPAPAPAGELV
jgi:hypothetical protein